MQRSAALAILISFSACADPADVDATDLREAGAGECEDADLDGDGIVGFSDFLLVAGDYGPDGTYEFDDFLNVSEFYGESCEEVVEPDPEDRDPGPGGDGAGMCRGICHEVTIDKNQCGGDDDDEIETYSCPDAGWSAVNEDSRMPTTDCWKVVKCIADGNCEHLKSEGVAIRADASSGCDQYEDDGCRQDESGTWYMRAWPYVQPDTFRLCQHGEEPLTQKPVGYNYSTPSSDVSALLGGRNPCPHTTELTTIDRDCADKNEVDDQTEQCFDDSWNGPSETYDVPRQYVHYDGKLPKWLEDRNPVVDAANCGFAIAGVAGGIGAAYYTGGAAGPWSAVWAAGGIPALSSCIPKPGKRFDVYLPGNSFQHVAPRNGPLGYGMGDLDWADAKIKGQVCGRELEFEWKHNRFAALARYQIWGVGAEDPTKEAIKAGSVVWEVGEQLFDEPDTRLVTARATEPCRCKDPDDPGSVGLDCDSVLGDEDDFPYLFGDWLVSEVGSDTEGTGNWGWCMSCDPGDTPDEDGYLPVSTHVTCVEDDGNWIEDETAPSCDSAGPPTCD
ncbi:MAG: hypothetical protein AAF721_16100 [Myxococcota bacterium]